MNYDPRNPESRRLRRFDIGRDTLTAILRGQVEVVPGQFPEDAEFTWVGYKTMRNLTGSSVVVYVWSSEFDVIHCGLMVPDCGSIKLRSVPKDEVKPSDSGESGESSESWRQRPSLFQ